MWQSEVVCYSNVIVFSIKLKVISQARRLIQKTRINTQAQAQAQGFIVSEELHTMCYRSDGRHNQQYQ